MRVETGTDVDRMKVNFLVVGAQKSGTTAMDRYLRTHDEIEMAKAKEVHFFDNESNFVSEVDYSDYHSSFDCDLSKSVRGEVTPIYMYWSDAARRIWDYNPKMKIIVILRNPIYRAFSQWNMERDREMDSLSFSEAIRTETERCREALPLQHRVYSYVDRGFYVEQIRRLWSFFSKEQVLILKHENLKYELASTLSQVSKFLRIRDYDRVQYQNFHSRLYGSPMSGPDYEYLSKLFYYEIKNLENMLGWDCSDWLEKST